MRPLQQALDGTGKQEQIVQGTVEERFYAEMIPGAEQPLVGLIPDSKGKVTQQVLRRSRVPLKVSFQ